LELIEPIILFDFLEETVYNISGGFVAGFQAELELITGQKWTFNLPTRDKLTNTYFDQTGSLLKDERLIPSCLQKLEIVENGDNGFRLKGSIAITGEHFSAVLGHLSILWELQSGIWEVIEAEFTSSSQ